MNEFTKEELKNILYWFEFCEEEDEGRGRQPTNEEKELACKIKNIIKGR